MKKIYSFVNFKLRTMHKNNINLIRNNIKMIENKVNKKIKLETDNVYYHISNCISIICCGSTISFMLLNK